jgi:hypothetical protein
VSERRTLVDDSEPEQFEPELPGVPLAQFEEQSREAEKAMLASVAGATVESTGLGADGLAACRVEYTQLQEGEILELKALFNGWVDGVSVLPGIAPHNVC